MINTAAASTMPRPARHVALVAGLAGLAAAMVFVPGGDLVVVAGVGAVAVVAAGFAATPFLLVLLFVAANASFSRTFSGVGLPPLFVTEIVMVLVLASAVLRPRLALLTLRRALRAPGASWVTRLVVLYIAYGALRLAVSIPGGLDPLESGRNFVIVSYAVFTLFAIVGVGAAPRRRVELLLDVVFWGATAAALFLIISFALVVSPTELNPYFKVVNVHHALHSIVAALVAFVHLMETRRETRVPRLVWLVGLGVNLLAIYMSGHRSALLATGMGMLMIWIRTGIRLRTIVAVGAVAVLLVPAGRVAPIGAAVSTISQKYLSFFETEETNVAWRLTFWVNVLSAWSESPVIGFGYNRPFIDYMPGAKRGMERNNPHNSYVTILARSGVIGLGLFLVIALLAVRGLWRLSARANPERGPPLILMSALAATGVFAAFNVVIETPYYGSMYWLLIGLAIALVVASRSGDELRDA